jgi:hypothetical protein
MNFFQRMCQSRDPIAFERATRWPGYSDSDHYLEALDCHQGALERLYDGTGRGSRATDADRSL